MFKKRVLLFEKRDRETWTRIKAALKETGFSGVQSGHYLQESVVSCGCGAHLDPRDFGKNGKIDRDIYWVKVLEGDGEKAREVLLRRGIVPEVDETVRLDAPHRKQAKEAGD